MRTALLIVLALLPTPALAENIRLRDPANDAWLRVNLTRQDGDPLLPWGIKASTGNRFFTVHETFWIERADASFTMQDNLRSLFQTTHVLDATVPALSVRVMDVQGGFQRFLYEPGGEVFLAGTNVPEPMSALLLLFPVVLILRGAK